MRARGLFVALVAGAAFVPSLPQAASAEGPVVVELDSPVGRGAMVPGNARLLDTRSGSATVDGVGVGAGRVAADGFIEIPTSGRLDIRADAAALVLNLTIVQPGAAGYATAYVCTEGRNGTSSVNFAAAEDIANTVVLPGDRGALCVYTSAAAHVVVDYTAQLIDQADYRSDVRRVVDTRSDIGLSKATPRAFVPLPHIDVGDPRRSLLLNVVVTESAAPGWLWIGDCDRDNFVAAGVGPGVSTVNFAAGATRANLALAGGTAQCVYTSTDVEVVIDIVGSVDVSGTDRQLPDNVFENIERSGQIGNVQRVFDSRPDFDGDISTRLSAREVRVIPDDFDVFADQGQSHVRFLNVTVENPAADGHLVISGCQPPTPGPLPSALNYRAGETIAHLSAVAIGTSGDMCVTTTSDADVVIDSVGHIFIEAPLSFSVGICRPTHLPDGLGVLDDSNVFFSDGVELGRLPSAGPTRVLIYDGTGPYTVTATPSPDLPIELHRRFGDLTLSAKVADAEIGTYEIDIAVSDAAGATARGSVEVTRSPDRILDFPSPPISDLIKIGPTISRTSC